MLESELKKIWQDSTREELIKFNKSHFLIDLNTQIKDFDRSLKNRDMREIIAAALLIPALCISAWYVPETLSKFALLMGIPWCVLVIYKFRHVKKHKVQNYSLPLKEFLRKHKIYLMHERKLLDTIVYWYLLPPFVFSMLFIIGRNTEDKQRIVFLIVHLLIYIFIYILNKRSIKKDFDPIIERVHTTIENYEKEE